MMEAVANGKAHGLFDKRRATIFKGVRRPQEDMVTSAVFGSAMLLPKKDHRRAVSLILGEDCFEAAGFPTDAEIAVEFWPSFPGTGSRSRVEPDVILSCDGRAVIVEVKWHSPLPSNQIADEIDAVVSSEEYDDVKALLLLGDADGYEEPLVKDIPVLGRTWREVSADLVGDGALDTPFDRWKTILHAFLQKTDLGHTFNGLDIGCLFEQGRVSYRFQRAGDPPWFRQFLHESGDVLYSYDRRAFFEKEYAIEPVGTLTYIYKEGHV